MFVQQLLCYCKLGQSCEAARVNNAGPRTTASCQRREMTKITETQADITPGLLVHIRARSSETPQSNMKPTANSDLNEHKKPDLSDMFCPVETGLCFSVS